MAGIIGREFDPFSLEALRIPIGMIEGQFRKPLPRHGARDPFIKGPIAYSWVAAACRLPGIGLHIAMAYRLHAKRFAFSEGRHWGVMDMAEGFRVARQTVQHGLHSAEVAGLLSILREPGCKLRVSILDLPASPDGLRRRPLHGPIPWAWWFPASQLPGKSLQVAAVCWLLASWRRSAEFDLTLEDWSEFGLSRSSVSRGLGALEGAGLVSAVRRTGRPSVVTILDPNLTKGGNHA
jgi:DNA-binding transcriptional ArsR family regulator